MIEQNNPYAPPMANVEEIPDDTGDQTFIAEGRSVPAGHATEWLSNGWEMYKQNAGMWTLFGFLFMLVIMLTSCIPLASQVMGALMVAGFMIAAERYRTTGSLEVGDLFAGFQTNAGQLAILGLIQGGIYLAIFLPPYILYIVCMLAFKDQPVLVLGTALLQQIAGLIAMALLFMSNLSAPVLVAFHGVKPFDAYKTSMSVCMKNIGAVLILFLLSFVLGIVALIPCGLGLLVLVPVYQLAVYSSYRDIFLQDAT